MWITPVATAVRSVIFLPPTSTMRARPSSLKWVSGLLIAQFYNSWLWSQAKQGLSVLIRRGFIKPEEIAVRVLESGQFAIGINLECFGKLNSLL